MRIGKIAEWTNQTQTLYLNDIKLKPMQKAIVNCNQRHDVLVNLPTGFGKSLLFQYPASRLRGACIVVFVPLKALLWDCIKEAALFGLDSFELTSAFIKNYNQGKHELPPLLFLTPERLFKNDAVLSFLDYLNSEGKIELIVIDEAHCISEWGSDFRPDYARLCDLRRMFPGVRLLAMSATIPPEAREDLRVKLRIPGCYYFQASSNRPNLIYEVKNTEKRDLAQEIIYYINKKKIKGHPGIIYCQTIKHAKELHGKLMELKFNCLLFHSKLSEKDRSQFFNTFMSRDDQVIVATICFGMGVNKKNIRFVINVGVSQSAQNYYQESGRAGRDGLEAYCLLLSWKGDVMPLEFLIQKSTTKKALKQRRFFKLNQIKEYTNCQQCKKKYLFAILGEDFSPDQCKKTCDFCLNDDGRQDYKNQDFVEVDYTQKVMNIMNIIAGIKVEFTKTMIVDVLKGTKLKLNSKLNSQKVKPLFGKLKDQSRENICALIDVMVEKQILLYRIKKGGRGFSFKVLSPCSRLQLKKVDRVVIKIRKRFDSGYSQKDSGKQKFDNFLAKKNKSKSFQLKQKTQKIGRITDKYLSMEPLDLDLGEKAERRKIELKKPGIRQSNDEEDLKEIKMVEMNPDYQHFFDSLFDYGFQLNDKEEEGSMGRVDTEDIDEVEEEGQGLPEAELTALELEQFESSLNDFSPSRGLTQHKKEYSEKEEKKLQSDSQDDEKLVQLFRKKKLEEAKSKLVVVRRQISKEDLDLDFL